MFKNILFLLCLTILNVTNISAEINKNAEFVFKIKLAKKPTTRPQTIAYIPGEKKYYRITVPPKTWFGFKGMGKPESIILNLTNIEYNSREILRRNRNKIKFNW